MFKIITIIVFSLVVLCCREGSENVGIKEENKIRISAEIYNHSLVEKYLITEEVAQSDVMFIFNLEESGGDAISPSAEVEWSILFTYGDQSKMLFVNRELINLKSGENNDENNKILQKILRAIIDVEKLKSHKVELSPF